MDAKYIKCVAKCCGNKLLDRSDLTFFTFPEDDKLAKIWARNAGIESYQYGSTLCSEHFENIYFDDTYKKKSVFKQNVQPVPTIFHQKPEEDSNKQMAKQPEIQEDPPPLAVFKQYCRLCANFLPVPSLISLFDTSNNFSDLLQLCLPGKVKINDALPHSICMPCAHKLVSCSATIKSFKEADKKLRDLFETRPSTSKDMTGVINISDDEAEIGDNSDDDAFDLSKDDMDIDEVEAEDILNVLETVLEETNKILDEIVPDEIIEDDDNAKSTRNISQNMENIMSKNKQQIKFKCIRCNAVFSTKEKIMIHAFHDHPESRGDKLISNIIKSTNNIMQEDADKSILAKKYKCMMCSVETPTEEGIIKHTQINHKNISNDKILTKVIEVPEVTKVKYMCVSCPKVFNSTRHIQEHARFMHPNNTIISKTILVDHKTSGFNKNAVNSIIPSDNINNNFEGRRRHKWWEQELDELLTYKIKYQCKCCPNIYETYKESLDHYNETHLDSEFTGLPVILVKIDEENEIVTVDDGTIYEADPKIVEKRPKLKNSQTGVKFKCLQCPKIFGTKKLILQHSLDSHPVTGKEIKCKLVAVTNKDKNYHHRRERYECLMCSSHHVTKFSLMHHTKTLHPILSSQKYLFRLIEPKNMKAEPLQCLHCNIKPLNYSRYKKHIKKHLKFKCEQCEEEFKNMNNLKGHLKEHDKLGTTEEPEKYSCIVCQQEFEDKTELLKHENIHKEPKDVQCTHPKCNKRFISDYELKKHERCKHKTCLCDVCGKVFEVSYLRNHLQTHNRDQPYGCKVENCNKRFKTISALSKHRRQHLGIKKQTVCTVCGKVLSVFSISLHMKIHSRERNEVCDICGAGFYRRDHLRHHRARHSQIGTNKRLLPYECPKCDITLDNRAEYLSHAALVHGIEEPKTTVPGRKRCRQPKNLSCVLCHKTFTHRCYLEEHYRMHRGEKVNKCTVCSKAFATKLTLYQHKLTHLSYDQYRYQCEYCKKRFKRSSQLRDHKRIHTGEKPFPCPICQRPFRVRGEMVKHMRIHTRKNEREIKKDLPITSEKMYESSEEESEDESEDKVITNDDGETIYFIQQEDDSPIEYIISDMPDLE